jgi:hypothetical protein
MHVTLPETPKMAQSIKRQHKAGVGTGRATARFLSIAVAMLGALSAAQAQDSTAKAAGPAAPTVKIDPKITVEVMKRGSGPDILIRGKGFTPSGSIRLIGTQPPGAASRLDFGSIKADSTGGFVFRKSESCTTNDVQQTVREVNFTATDDASKKVAKGRFDGGPWMC